MQQQNGRFCNIRYRNLYFKHLCSVKGFAGKWLEYSVLIVRSPSFRNQVTVQ